jgi:hypothetical protein
MLTKDSPKFRITTNNLSKYRIEVLYTNVHGFCKDTYEYIPISSLDYYSGYHCYYSSLTEALLTIDILIKGGDNLWNFVPIEETIAVDGGE